MPCDVKFSNLHSALTLSLLERSSVVNSINRWAQFQNLWMPCKKMSKRLCDRKNKRYETNEKMMIDSGRTRALRLPNEARVIEVLFMLQDLLCSFHATCEHGDKDQNFKSFVLSRTAWQQVAEFEAIVRKSYHLCFDFQSDRPETPTKIMFCIAMVDVACQEETVFDVVNLNATKWPATMTFKDAPTVKIATNSSHDTALQPMRNECVELTDRLANSCEEHFSQHDPG